MSTGEQVHPGPPNGLELSCPAARATVHSFSRILTGQSPPNLPHASRVSCSELLGSTLSVRSCACHELRPERLKIAQDLG